MLPRTAILCNSLKMQIQIRLKVQIHKKSPADGNLFIEFSPSCSDRERRFLPLLSKE